MIWKYTRTWFNMCTSFVSIVAVFVVLVCPLLSNSQTNPPSSGENCSFNGLEYTRGESWHPFLHPFGEMACINCTCMEDGDVTCSTTKCPKLECRNPISVEGQCCAICTDNIPPSFGSLGPEESQDYLPEPYTPNIGTSHPCQHGGQLYRHSQVFPSNSTALQKTQPNQCVLCICMDGDTLCHLKTCPEVHCMQMFTPDDDCCPVCLVDTTIQDNVGIHSPYDFLDTGTSTYLGPDPPAQNGDCQAGHKGHYHTNGSLWHPIIGPFGQMDCVTCTCLNNVVTCQREICPLPESLPCRKPKQVEGHCCKQCVTGKTRKHTKEVEEIDQGGELITVKACPPKHLDTVTYLSTKNKQILLVFMNTKTNAMQTYKWKIKNGISVDWKVDKYEEPTLNLDINTNDELKVQGAVKSRNLPKFAKRLEKYMKKCKQNCRRKQILKLLKKLRTKPVLYKYDC